MVAIILTYIIHLSRLAIRRREEEKLAIEKKNAVLAEEKRNLEEAMAQYKKNYSDLKLRYFRSLHLLIPYGRCTSGAGDILARHRLSRPVCRRLFCRGMTLQYEEFQ